MFKSQQIIQIKRYVSMYVVLIALLVVWMGCKVLDARYSQRPVWPSFTQDYAVLALSNVVAHWGTPDWLRALLAKSPVLSVTPQLFPHVEDLRKALPVLQAEMQAAVVRARPFTNETFFGGFDVPGWRRFYLKWYGPVDPVARRWCPRTCALLETMPEVNIAMFSVLEPGTVIPPHYGPFRGGLRYHLALDAPGHPSCRLRVLHTDYVWRTGEDVMFDDTFVHSVCNMTDRRRIVLFVDVKRPQTSSVWGALTRAAINVLGPLSHRVNDPQETMQPVS